MPNNITRIDPVVFTPFNPDPFVVMKEHVRQIRTAFDWPGIPLHDANETDPQRKFNRWAWHNLPMAVLYHRDPEFISTISNMVGMDLTPSYNFLSMYSASGVCPLHTDRPQCQFTVDLCVRQDGSWPIYIEGQPYDLQEGQAVLYSGTGSPHYRNPMYADGTSTYADLLFFHFVPRTFLGSLE